MVGRGINTRAIAYCGIEDIPVGEGVVFVNPALYYIGEGCSLSTQDINKIANRLVAKESP